MYIFRDTRFVRPYCEMIYLCWVHCGFKYVTLYPHKYEYLNNIFPEIQESLDKAVKEAILEQEALGIDVITDGELARDNYIFHFW